MLKAFQNEVCRALDSVGIQLNHAINVELSQSRSLSVKKHTIYSFPLRMHASIRLKLFGNKLRTPIHARLNICMSIWVSVLT